jgi:hypothetical protein
MKRHSIRGVALVITLVMLAVVTLMAVTFLAVSRRERSAVTVTEEQTTARLMADAALARAQAEVVAKMFARANLLAYDLLVSTNYIERAGFAPNQARGNYNFTNVNYDYQQNGRPLSGDQALVNLTNLFYDPRPPVFVRTNEDPKLPLDFRFYLDLNRNWRFETNGELPVMSRLNKVYDLDGEEVSYAPGRSCLSNFFIGDPEWIGVLNYPDWPHSPSNRFIGRWAYLVLPAGKSLDWNFIHNHAALSPGQNEDLKLAEDRFYRNQGVGSWELNLAAFLRDLNTNVWTDYVYHGYGPPSLAQTFLDALGFLRYRYASNYANLKSVDSLFGPRGGAAFQTDDIDGYSDGPPEGGVKVLESTAANKDKPDRPWAGSDNPAGYFEPQELFDPTKVPGQGAAPYWKRLLDAQTNNDSYDRYTFHRMLGQIGMDSAPANRGKMNLNYDHLTTNAATLAGGPNATNFVPWSPLAFFTNAAERLLQASRWTNTFPIAYTDTAGAARTGLVSRLFIGDTEVRPEFCLTNILVYGVFSSNVAFLPPSLLLPPLGDNSAQRMPVPAYGTTLARQPVNTEYTPAIHRLLQVAANIYDAMTNRCVDPRDPPGGFMVTNAPPTVFRPLFGVEVDSWHTNICIRSFVEVTNAAFLNRPFYDVHDAAQLRQIITLGKGKPFVDLNLYSVPLIIGAKKGLPNFNEVSLLSLAQATRKVELRRKAGAPVSLQVTNMAAGLTDEEMQRIAQGFDINQTYLLSISNRLGLECWNSYTQDYRRLLRVRVEGDLLQTLTSTNRGIANDLARATYQSNHYRADIALSGWRGNDFLLPVLTNMILLSNAVYNYSASSLPFDARAKPPAVDNRTRFYIPEWSLYVTNRFYYALIDEASGRVLDFVSFANLTTKRDLSGRMNRTAHPPPGRSRALQFEPWMTNRYNNSQLAADWTYGVQRQLAFSCGKPDPGASIWRNYNAEVTDKTLSQRMFREFLSDPKQTVHQAPFSPSLRLRREWSWQVNDPLVHYVAGDLARVDLTSAGAVVATADDDPDEALPVTDTPLSNRNLGAVNVRVVYRPWGQPGREDIAAYDPRLKDPLIRRSDDWDFPTNKFPNLGWLGRVHRGTPWQTIYLKSGRVGLAGWGVDTNELLPCAIAGVPGTNTTWYNWAFSLGTHPTNDWKLLDVFTAAPNDNAARGLLSVNQDRLAAWSAVLSGVLALTNTTPLSRTNNAAAYVEVQIHPNAQPNSPQLRWIVNGINRARAYQTNGVFNRLGDLLATPELTFASPFITPDNLVNDLILERIPQQILSLVKADEPRFVVYAFGQSLREAPNSIYLSPGPFYQLCTNYQVRGEFATKTVFRVEGSITNLHAVVESYNELPVE